MLDSSYFSTLFEWISDGVAISDLAGDVLYLNPAAEKITAFSREALKGKKLCEALCGHLYGSDPRDFALFCPLRKGQSSECSICFKGVYQPNKDLKARHLRIHCFRPPVSEGGVEEEGRHLTLMEDISSETELEEHKKDWQNMVAHDLRSPLSTILGALQLFPTLHSFSSDEKYWINVSLNAGKRMIKLLNLYLDISKLDAGLMLVHFESFPLSPLIQNYVDEIMPLVRSRQMTVLVNISSQLEVYADRDLLLRVVQNLIDNAIKYTSEGGCVIASAEHLTHHRGVRLSVKDTGSGISPQDLPHVFDRFYQARVRQEGGTQGTGLGLTFCKEALKAMGGTIEVFSKQGEGTEFLVELMTKIETPLPFFTVG
ncbi:MAG: PAS domain-containing sensor histidine kinase [Chlamydiae bacterium]|nr:PAS domain-containing sensor histidine kinase [Chlamydiota bacterium]MBI3265435.1 PAS domain-containing sensor histidine kinase [Chlamydiota bacterium]